MDRVGLESIFLFLDGYHSLPDSLLTRTLFCRLLLQEQLVCIAEWSHYKGNEGIFLCSFVRNSLSSPCLYCKTKISRQHFNILQKAANHPLTSVYINSIITSPWLRILPFQARNEALEKFKLNGETNKEFYTAHHYAFISINSKQRLEELMKSREKLLLPFSVHPATFSRLKIIVYLCIEQLQHQLCSTLYCCY